MKNIASIKLVRSIHGQLLFSLKKRAVARLSSLIFYRIGCKKSCRYNGGHCTKTSEHIKVI